MNTVPATRSNSTRQPLVPSRAPPMLPPNFSARERRFADEIMSIFYTDSTDLQEWLWIKRVLQSSPKIKEYLLNSDDTWVRSMTRKLNQKIDSFMNVVRNNEADENLMTEGQGLPKAQGDYCLKCKKKTKGTNISEFTAKNGRRMRRSKCVECLSAKCAMM